MKTYKGDPTRPHPTQPNDRIDFCLTLPSFEGLHAWAQFADDEAVKIEAVLWRNLPGGVYDRIFAKMAERAASLLRVLKG